MFSKSGRHEAGVAVFCLFCVCASAQGALAQQVPAQGSSSLGSTRRPDAQVSSPGQSEAARLQHLWKRSRENVRLHPEQALALARQALSLARRRGTEGEVASSLQSIGNIYRRQGRLEQALTYQQRARKVAEAAGDEQGAARALGSAATIYSTQGNLPRALRYYLRALKRFKQAGTWHAVATCLNNIALVHQRQGNLEKSLTYYDRAAQLHEATGDSVGLARVLNNKAIIFIKRRAFDKALEHSRRALQLSRKQDDRRGAAFAHNNIGVALNRQEHPSEALVHLKKAARWGRGQGEKRMLAYTYDEMGRAYQKLGRLEEALTYARRGLRLAEDMGAAEGLKATRQTLAAVYAARGDYERAYHVHQQYSAARDSVFSEKRAALIAQMQARYETQKKEQQIENLEQENHIQDLEAQRQQQTRNGLLGGLALVLLLAGVLYNRYRLKRKANRLLAARKAKIEASLEEKELLVKEIHHRVKNNLQVIASLIGLQAQTLDAPRPLAAIRDVQHRVEAMALVHRKLYDGHDNLARVDVQRYLEELSSVLIEAFALRNAFAPREEAIRCRVRAHGIELKPGTVIPLGLIVNELVSNALEHAFPQEKEGKVRVSLRQHDGECVLRVADDGVGLPEDVRKDLRARPASSIGLTLVEDLTRQLGGEMHVENGVGVAFTIRFQERFQEEAA